MDVWKSSFIAVSAGLVLAVGVGTSLAGQSGTGPGEAAERVAVRVTEQAGWSVEADNEARFAASLRTLAAKAKRSVATLAADGDTSGEYFTINVRVAGNGRPAAANRLQMVVSAGDLRLVGVTSPTSNEFFALDRGAPDFLPPPVGARGATGSRAADVPLVRREILPPAVQADSPAATGTGADAGAGDAGAGDAGAGDAGAGDAAGAGDQAADQGGQEAAGQVPGIQDVLGALNTLLQVVNGENVPIDQVINAAGIMAQVIGLLLG